MKKLLLDITFDHLFTDNSSPIRTAYIGKSISGVVKQKDTTIRSHVKLYEKNSGKLVAIQLTDENGYYEFNHLYDGIFFLVSHHPTSEYNAVIQDNVRSK